MSGFLASLYILIGTYTGGESKGIYVFEFDPDTARTRYVGLTELDNPSYVTSRGDVVYAISESDPGWMSTFRFGSGGELSPLASLRTGAGPCYVATDGRLTATANYGGGDISVFSAAGASQTEIHLSSARLSGQADENLARERTEAYVTESNSMSNAASEPRSRQRMHCVRFSPDGRYLFAADLGTDRLLRWDISAGASGVDTESLKSFSLPSDSGPRHFVFSGDGQSLYLVNEFSGMVMAFDYNGGDLRLRQTVDADPADGGGSADIVLSGDGRFLYVSNRLKNDGVSIFSVDGDGLLGLCGYKTTGVHPRNLSLSPDGRFLLVSCRDSGVVQIFAVDRTTGSLTPTQFAIDIDSPVCVHFIEG